MDSKKPQTSSHIPNGNHFDRINYAELEVGAVVSHKSYTLDRESVKKYVSAVKDTSAHPKTNTVDPAPPMSIAALSLRGCLLYTSDAADEL